MLARPTRLAAFVLVLCGAVANVGCNLNEPPPDSASNDTASDQPAPSNDGVGFPVPESPGSDDAPELDATEVLDPIEEFESEDLSGYVVDVDGDIERLDSLDLRALSVGTRIVFSVPDNAPAPTRQFGGGCDCLWSVLALDGNDPEPIGVFDPRDACTTTYTVLNVGDALITVTQTCGDRASVHFSQGISALAEAAGVDDSDSDEEDDDVVALPPAGGGGGGGGGDPPTPPVCGNNVVESGEECDPPDERNCDDDCLLIELANDSCDVATPVIDGAVAITTSDATTDRLVEDAACDAFDVNADTWFCYSASCNGDVTVSLCGSDFDTTLAVYGGCDCPTDPAVACDDDGCPMGTGSRLTIAANLGDPFLIRVGGFDGAQGDGTLNITCHAAALEAPTVSIETPERDTVTASVATNVKGTATGAISVFVNGVGAVLNGDMFTAADVHLPEGTSVLVVTAEGRDGQTATDSRSIRRDTAAPLIVIESPHDGDLLITETVTVAGTVNDIIPGATVNADDVTVTINGIEATVNNRTFIVPDVSLALGANLITARVVDRVGNVGDSSIEVTREPDLAGVRIVILGGNAQSQPINSALPIPLSVRLEMIDGTPRAGRPVQFEVSRGDGSLGNPADSVRAVTLLTGANGEAEVDFVVGSRTGQGFHRVRVTTPGSLTYAEFCATARPAAPTNIAVVMIPPARGVAGQTLRDPLCVIITDEGGNPVPNVLVTFDAVFGGGHFFGQSSLMTTSDLDGNAGTLWTLGPESGLGNNEAIVTFEGNPGLPVTLTVSGVAVGAVEDTKVSGIVQDSAGRPIVGARAVIRGRDLSALTGPDGKFTIIDVPPGGHHVGILGSAANAPANGIFFPDIDFALGVIAGVDNMIDPPIIVLPFLNNNGARLAGGDEDVILTIPGVSGFAIKVFAHSTFVLDPVTGERVQQPLMMSSSQVKFDKLPMPPPQGSTPMLVGTLQPSGVLLNPPAQVTYPNVEGLAPGDVADVFAFHHDIGQFVNIGPGTVSEDGSVVASDPGFGIVQSGWHCLIRVPGTAAECANGCTASFTWEITANGTINGSAPFGDARKKVLMRAIDGEPANQQQAKVTVNFNPAGTLNDADDAPNNWGIGAGAEVIEIVNPSNTNVVTIRAKMAGTAILRSPTSRVNLTPEEGGDKTCVALITVLVTDIAVEWLEMDGTPITEANDHPSGTVGLKYFPGATTPSGDPNDTVKVRVTITPPREGVAVFLKALDPDDPSSDTAPVDSNGLTGADNRGSSGSLDERSGTTDAAGRFETEFTVAHQPGDNHRIAAAIIEESRLDVLDGLPIPPSDDQLVAFEGKMSSLLTVWRKLHIEVDSMRSESTVALTDRSPDITFDTIQTITPNTPPVGTGACTDIISTTNCTTLTLNGTLPIAAGADFYEGGRIGVPGAHFLILSNTDNVTGISDDEIVIRGVPTATQRTLLLGGPIEIRDDDAIAPQLPITTVMTTWIEDQYQRAYISIEEVGADLNRTPLVAFDHQMNGGEYENEARFGVGWASGRELDSSKDYWAHTVVMVYQLVKAFTDSGEGDPDRFENSRMHTNVPCEATAVGLPAGFTVCRPTGEADPTLGLTINLGLDFDDHETAIFVETIRDAAQVDDLNTTAVFAYTTQVNNLEFIIRVLQGRVDGGDASALPDLVAAQLQLVQLLANPVTLTSRVTGDGTVLEATVAHEIGHGPKGEGRDTHHDESGLMGTGGSSRDAGFSLNTINRFRSTARW